MKKIIVMEGDTLYIRRWLKWYVVIANKLIPVKMKVRRLRKKK